MTVGWYTAPYDGYFVIGMLTDPVRAPKRYPGRHDSGFLLLFPERHAAREFLRRDIGVGCPNDFLS